MSDNAPIIIKLIVIGESFVGKSSLTVRLVQNKFSEDTTTTIGYAYMKTNLITDDQIPVQLDIFDTAGQEKFNALIPNFYRGADGALLVYDVTQPKSLSRLRYWLDEMNKYIGRYDAVTILVGNKIDMRCDDIIETCVTTEQGRNWAKNNAMLFVETSAKTAENVQGAFQSVMKLSRQYQDAQIRRRAMVKNPDVKRLKPLLDEKEPDRNSHGLRPAKHCIIL